ncbi:unnamed protein product [Ceratitis capitata]|uniref:(Mediterranean fruit fly) hypothetical protein n=1 Tax=Ceratitis capitata TaxID=7213 RepID=A0A811UI35_CERCA|nr:unnamed protein product [Ceratitis capitata]
MSVPVAIKTEELILESAEYNSTEELDEELQLQLDDSGGEFIQYQAEPQLPQQRQRQSSSGMNSDGSPSTKNGNGATASGGNAANNNGGNKNLLESEKRMRREIANSNERRRMQSINAGFQNLRSLLPRHEGDKLSKNFSVFACSRVFLRFEYTSNCSTAQCGTPTPYQSLTPYQNTVLGGKNSNWPLDFEKNIITNSVFLMIIEEEEEDSVSYVA